MSKFEQGFGRSPFTRHDLPAVVLLALCCAAGCRTTPYQKAEGTARTLERAVGQVQWQSQCIERALETLNDLVNKPGADLRPQFKQFTVALDRLADSSAQLDGTRKHAQRKGDAYFNEWDEQLAGIHFEKVRLQSEARKAEVTNQFHSMTRHYDESQTVVRALITYLNDIRTALNADLTSAGLASVKEVVNNANQNGRKVQTALAQLSNELAKSSVNMSSFVVQNPAQQTEEPRTSVRTRQESSPRPAEVQ
jgi:hypothetical protein